MHDKYAISHAPHDAGASDDAAVVVRCLGDFSVALQGTPVLKWRAGKARHLFQYLMMNRGRLMLREQLYEALWPGSEWTPSSSSLKVAMHALRQVLRAEADRQGRPAVTIEYRDHGYILLADGVWVDAEEMERQVEGGALTERHGDTAAAAAHYWRAVTLYRGEFLPGETTDWVAEQREWTRSTVLRALHRLRELALRDAQYAEATRFCRQILDVDPYQEEAYQTLMYVHGKRGELGSVKSWHDVCARRLSQGLDAQPAPRTRRLLDDALHGRLAPQM
ncbi:winged helix-turn-helix domain-containing protein [Streptomyces sp. ICN988]|uniref:AfsR/SARP family transcriptional regulator n=1 Tax=unclassified Streptomyces TaxID=2593676 RepID=UPI0021E4D4AF|nr:BTAD domain-containing putative transcriptional regulator [Streptomyces sp. ICN988]MCV2458636.1 winged helix-turn-helix domain-containing protein [Streptomyces sp. ICN988]